MKIVEDRNAKGDFIHFCPGCKEIHRINTVTPLRNGSKWVFDGNYDLPTFSPSINLSLRDEFLNEVVGRCHYFIRNGSIQFLPDCTHIYAGMSIRMVDLEDYIIDRYRL